MCVGRILVLEQSGLILGLLEESNAFGIPALGGEIAAAEHTGQGDPGQQRHHETQQAKSTTTADKRIGCAHVADTPFPVEKRDEK